MSALDDLARAKSALRAELLLKRPPGRLSEDRADEFLDEFQAALKAAYAHALAEKQREDIDLAVHTGESVMTCEDCAVVRAAASIDPEAQR